MDKNSFYYKEERQELMHEYWQGSPVELLQQLNRNMDDRYSLIVKDIVVQTYKDLWRSKNEISEKNEGNDTELGEINISPYNYQL